MPPAPRTDLVAVISFLSGALTDRDDLQPADLLRLNVAIPHTPPANQERLGVIGGDVAGFPNGRRPGDEVVDILKRVVGGGILSAEPNAEGGAYSDTFPNNALNDGVNGNDVPYLPTFPYLGTPHEGYVQFGVRHPRRGALTRASEVLPEVRLRRCGAAAPTSSRRIPGSFFRRMRAVGYPIHVWTVNESARMAALLPKVEAVITDRPVVALTLRDG